MATQSEANRKPALPLSATDVRVFRAVEEERRRIAMELHDDLGQQLTSSLIIAYQCHESIPDSDVEAKSLAAEVIECHRRIALASQRLVSNLQPGPALKFGLAFAVNNLVLEIQDLGVSAHFDDQLDDVELHPDTVLHLYRIVQEAANNVVKHSGGGNLDILICASEDNLVVVTITDTGKGFDLKRADHGRSGLSNMALHARMLNGDFSIQSVLNDDSASNHGTVVRCSILRTTVPVQVSSV